MQPVFGSGFKSTPDSFESRITISLRLQPFEIKVTKLYGYNTATTDVQHSLKYRENCGFIPGVLEDRLLEPLLQVVINCLVIVRSEKSERIGFPGRGRRDKLV